MYADLLDSERGTDFLSSEDYGALSQDLRQLEGIQTQQFAGVTDHWGTQVKKCHTFTIPFKSFYHAFYTNIILTLLGGDLGSSCSHELDVAEL